MNNLPDNYKDYYSNKTCHVKRQVQNVCNTTLGSLEIVKSQKCSGNLHVDGNAHIENIKTKTLISDTIHTNNIEIFDSLDISGDVSIMSDLSVNGNFLVEEDVSMNKNVFIGGDLVVGTTDILSELSKQETRIIMTAEGKVAAGQTPFSHGTGSSTQSNYGTYEFDAAKITKISIIMYSSASEYFESLSINICSSDNSGNIDAPTNHTLTKEGFTYVSDTINREIDEKHIWWVQIASTPGTQNHDQCLVLSVHILR